MMGKVFSYIKRPFINYAVEERASRLLDKNAQTKPKQHPLHPTEEKVLKKIQQEHPELIGKITAKNDKLDDYLKQVKVTSTIKKISPKLSSPTPELDEGGGHVDKSKLAKDRWHQWSKEPQIVSKYGLQDLPDEKVPRGKLTFRQAMDILSKIKAEDSSLTEAEKMAEIYKLNVDKTKSMLLYFRPFLTIGKPIPAHHEYPPENPTLPEAFDEQFQKKLAHDQNVIETKEKLVEQLERSRNYEEEKSKKQAEGSPENDIGSAKNR